MLVSGDGETGADGMSTTSAYLSGCAISYVGSVVEVSAYTLKPTSGIALPGRWAGHVEGVGVGLALRFSNVTTVNGTSHGASNGAAAHTAAHALSHRELLVLTQVARGLSNKQIGNKLGISDKTVRNHLSRIFRKLDAGNRTQAVMNAMKGGQLSI